MTATQLKNARARMQYSPKCGSIPWRVGIDDTLLPYFRRRQEPSVENECLLWGIRVLVPEALRSKLLSELHFDHPGSTRMKAVGRSYFWWPGLDKRIEELVKSCKSCQAVKSAPAAIPLHPWTWPSKPWQRIHVDFARIHVPDCSGCPF